MKKVSESICQCKMPFASAEIKPQYHLKILPSHPGAGPQQSHVPCEMGMLVPLLCVGMPMSVCAGRIETMSFHSRAVGEESKVEENKEEADQKCLRPLAAGVPWGKAENQL